MIASNRTLEVVQNIDRHRFEIELDGQFAVLEYQIRGELIYFTHTGVPFEYRGQGIAGDLVLAGLTHAEVETLKVVPLCSYVDVYIRRHRQFEPLLA